MRGATFARGGAVAGPVTLDLDGGETAALHCEGAPAAAIVARLATGMVKTSGGCVLIDDFDPHVQAAHCKRVAALVPHEPFSLDDGEFLRYVAYRAALWGVEPARARTHAEHLRKRLTGMHEAFAYPLIGALVVMPKLIVLDRPQAAYAARIRELTAGRALFSTHTDAATARAYSTAGLRLRNAAGA
jgi:ABC-type taurine transport system ATPase subunit